MDVSSHSVLKDEFQERCLVEEVLNSNYDFTTEEFLKMLTSRLNAQTSIVRR